jgi:hypothetical protein
VTEPPGGGPVPDKYDRDGIAVARPRPLPPGKFGLAAPLYLGLGYIPLPVWGKRLLVAGATGYNGVVTAQKVEQWTADFAAAHIALRADGWLGIDVDCYKGKTGDIQLAELEAELGPLPKTVSSTSRGEESKSRIYFYRVEQDVPRRGKAAPDIEVVHKFHRYAVVFPSIHPDTREDYNWYGLAGEFLSEEGPPPVAELPLLPEAWDSFLTRKLGVRGTDGPRELLDGPPSEWEGALNRQELGESAKKLLDEVVACPHVGHDELFWFVFRVGRLSFTFEERGVGRVLDFLKAKYFSETNESNPAAEWDNIVRWVATDSWIEKRSSFEFLRNFAAGLDASEWGSRDVI